MSQYGVFQALGMSFYSKALYRDVASNWGSKFLLCLLTLLALTWIGLTVEIHLGVNKQFRYFSAMLVQQVPVMMMTQGVLKTPESRPYLIKNLDTHENWGMIDTTGAHKEFETSMGSFLTTANEFIYQKEEGDLRYFKFDKGMSMKVVPVDVSAAFQKGLNYSWTVIYPLGVMFAFIYRLMEACLYSLFGLIITKCLGVRLSYQQLLGIMVIALTPTITCSFVVDIFDLGLPHKLFIYFLLAMGYLTYGIWANKSN